MLKYQFKTILKITGVVTTVGVSTSLIYKYKKNFTRAVEKLAYKRNYLPTREQLLHNLKSGKEYDVLIVGGGATGAGIALDAISRGLSTALVEKNDYSSGTSSRSTKLIHGGVRYLQKAIMSLDYKQFLMVREALSERANLLEIAPHLAQPIPIILPLYKLWHIPYYWAGIKMYDIVSLTQVLKSSYFMNKKRALEKFPVLNKDKLVGAIVYYDGQHDDSRMCLSILLTSIKYGADMLNYCNVESLLKDKNSKVVGASVVNSISGEKFDIKAKVVINATGAYTDSLRKMDNKDNANICRPSSGIHIVLPNYYSSAEMGLLDPCTKDGRVIFLLPWQNGTIAGTTDEDCKLTFEPAPSEEGINFILNELRNYFDKDISVRRSDVLSSWCGIRPLVIDPKAKNTESLARNHVINVSDNNLVTISGGKWTTYRQMAQETVDTAIKVGNLLPTNDCLTKGLLLDGSKGWSPLIPKMSLIQDLGIDPKVSHHLSATYGMNAYDVVSNAELSNKKWPILGRKLHENYPYLECEVKYSIKEYACSAVDVISRRIRIAFVNVYATLEILPKIINIMAKELNWNETRKKKEYEDCINFLKTQMGMHLREIPHETLTLTEDEIENFKKQYKILDSKNEGFLTYNRVAEYIRSINNDIKHTELHIIFNEIDMNRNGQIEMHEFIRFMDKIKSGTSNTIHLTKSSIGNLEVDSGHLKKRSGHGADE